MIARAIGADPVEFRLRPTLDEGEAFATGTSVKSFGIRQATAASGQAIEWSKPAREQSGTKLRGKGIAAGVKAVLTPSISGAIVILNADGTANVLSSTVEMGQGSETMMSQIVAEELGHHRRRGACCPTRHRCHALRYHHRRQSFDLPYG